MLRPSNERRSAPERRPRWQRLVGPFALSTVLHLVLIGLVALLLIRHVRPSAPSSFDTIWLDGPVQEFEIEVPAPPPRPESPADGVSANPGGTSLGIEFDPSVIASVGDGQSLDVSSPILSGATGRPASTDKKSEGPAANVKKGSTKPGKGRGQGEGDGVGNGRGPGFFGAVPKGKRIVFVVDNSRSMNATHDSPAKTRFRRLKEELIKSIVELPRESEFFVIFFADTMLSMPARTMQPATPEAKDFYLRWVAKVDANGSPTDPREAMRVGLALQPDVLYFLTDGEFRKGYSLTLRSIRQTRTAIHTFAFGETLAEETLRDIAQKNGGQYTFVP